MTYTHYCSLCRFEATGKLTFNRRSKLEICILKPTLGPPKRFRHLTRSEEVVMTRRRIGHTKATKCHILSKGPPTAGKTLTIENILLECTVLLHSRDKYYTVDSLGTLFETMAEACIIVFLRETGFFYLIWMAIYPIRFFIQISHQLMTSSSWLNPHCWTPPLDVALVAMGEPCLWMAANMSWRTCVAVKQMQSNPTAEIFFLKFISNFRQIRHY